MPDLPPSVVTPDGSFTYNPNGQFESLAIGETATDSFTATVTDSVGLAAPKAPRPSRLTVSMTPR
ncbi:MAG: Ig-like domain-containing protein [Pirellulaceae bacterium]